MFKNICHFVVWLDMCNCKLCIIKEQKRLFENLQKKALRMLTYQCDMPQAFLLWAWLCTVKREESKIFSTLAVCSERKWNSGERSREHKKGAVGNKRRGQGERRVMEKVRQRGWESETMLSWKLAWIWRAKQECKLVYPQGVWWCYREETSRKVYLIDDLPQ